MMNKEKQKKFDPCVLSGLDSKYNKEYYERVFCQKKLRLVILRNGGKIISASNIDVGL